MVHRYVRNVLYRWRMANDQVNTKRIQVSNWSVEEIEDDQPTVVRAAETSVETEPGQQPLNNSA